MTVGETELGMALRHLAEQEDRIARQERLVDRLRNVGAPLEAATDLLSLMEILLKDMEARVSRISH
jgi:hypothetical protein